MSETGAMSWKQRGRWAKDQRPPDEPKRSNHKDTKKWCKGVKGREHDYVWIPDQRHNWTGQPTDWYDKVCSKCQKHSGYCWISTGNYGCFITTKECKCGFHVKGSDGKWKIK